MNTTISTLSSSLMASILLVGCATVGPDYQAPSMETTASATSEPLRLETKVAQQWWLQFNDQSLNALIAIADRHNPSIAIAKANIAKAYAIFDDIEDNDWPSIGTSATYNAQRQVVPSAQNTHERMTLRSRQLGLTADWELDIVGKFERAEQAAIADAEAAYYAWQDARLALLANIANTYVQYRGLQAQLAVAKDTLDSLSRTESIVHSQVQAGFATELDELRIKSQIASVKADIPSISASTEAARQMLIAFAGGTQTLIGFDWESQQIPTLAAPVPLHHSKGFLKQRPDVQAAERRLAASSANIGVVSADLYPSISLSGFLGFFSAQGKILSSNAKAWSIAPEVSWQAFNLDSVRARIRAADADHQANFARFEQTVISAIAETKTALSNYTQLQHRVNALIEEESANKKALSLAQYQYENGSIDLLGLLDVERQWLASRQRQVDARTQMTNSLITIYTALGGGLLMES